MIFSNTFDTNGKFHWQVLCRIAALNIFGKLTRRSASVHKKNSTVDILLGIINEHFCWKKCYDMTKVWGHSKRDRRECWQKKVTKSDLGEGFAAKKCDVTQSKKTRFCEWRSFWMAPMMMFYFAVFFMSVFVDGVIRFLWNK